MIRTIISIFITFGVVFGASVCEIYYVNRTFNHFHSILESLYQKTENGTAAYEDGVAVQTYWREKKKTLHVCLPHTALQEVDYQLDEAVGFMYVKDYESTLPKIEVLLGLSESIPHSYSFNLQNIF